MAEERNEKEWRAELPEDDGYEEERLRRKWEREQEMKQTQRERRLREQKRKMRAIVLLAVAAALLIILLTVLIVNVFIPMARYHSAVRLLENGEYAEAIVAFRKMAGYKDADVRLDEAIRLQAETLVGKTDVRYETSESAPWFSISEGGTLSFDDDRYTGDWNIVIPDVFDGVLVTSLSKKMFAHTEELLSVEISECVLTIEDYAFLDCTGLETITLPSHLTAVGVSAFESCTSLRSVTFGEALTSIGASAFAKCKALTEIVLPTGLKTLNSRAFNGCTALTRVTLSAGLESVGSYVFSACTSLETVVFVGTETEWSALGGADRLGIGDAALVFTSEGE